MEQINETNKFDLFFIFDFAKSISVTILFHILMITIFVLIYL